MTNYTKKLVKGSLFILIANVLTGILGYFTRIVLSRHLSASEFGLFFAVLNFILIFDFFRDLGLSQALIKYLPEFIIKKDDNSVKSSIIIVFLSQLIPTSIFTIMALLFSKTLSLQFFKETASLPIIRIFVALFAVTMIYDLIKNIFQGFQKMNYFAYLEFSRKFLIFLLIYLALIFNYGLLGAVWSYVLGYILVIILFFPLLLKLFPLKAELNLSYNLGKKIFFFGIPVLFSYIGMSFIGYLDTLILVFFRTYEEVGIYNVVLPSALLVAFGIGAIETALLPLSSELWAKKEYIKVAKGLKLIQKYVLVLMIPIVAVFFVYSDFILNLVFGPSYKIGSTALKILLIGVLSFIVAQLNFSVISAIGKPKIVSKIIIAAAAFNLIFNIILIPLLGIVGAAFSTTISYTICLIASIISISKNIKIKMPVSTWLKLIIASFGMLFIMFLFRNLIQINMFLKIILSFMVGIFFYLILIFIQKILTLKEIKNLIKIIKTKKLGSINQNTP